MKRKTRHSWIRSEKGDTNFISIIVILGIVVVLAGIFIAFKDDILGTAEENLNAGNAAIKADEGQEHLQNAPGKH